MALGEYWLPKPIRGRWTPVGFPRRVRLGGRLFERARCKLRKPHVVEQYREDRPRNSAHLYVRDDGTFLLDHIDEDNPDYGRLIQHGLNDTESGRVITSALIGGALIGGTYLLSRGLDALLSSRTRT